MSDKVANDMHLKNKSQVGEAELGLQLNNESNQQVSGEPSLQLSAEPRSEGKMQVDGERTSEKSLNTIDEKQLEKGEMSHPKQLEKETPTNLAAQRSIDLKDSGMNRFREIIQDGTKERKLKQVDVCTLAEPCNTNKENSTQQKPRWRDAIDEAHSCKVGDSLNAMFLEQFKLNHFQELQGPNTKGYSKEEDVETVNNESQVSEQGDDNSKSESGNKQVSTDLEQFQVVLEKEMQFLNFASAEGYETNDLQLKKGCNRKWVFQPIRILTRNARRRNLRS